ncbi:c-type cytochrome [Thauera linaloolentis]|uniref:Cytochrome c-552 precourser n=1 Tax=Thauera linaloolentis (strain DSM 12138 / JCM 21573 / CCUG 41526 / CIP 105981 / IAM 15112 / NBRC 102519 / 47Lol) TaxID=1123367 RepID=N6XW21_THAL4|nr:c-type cytochrome [Thauera linaloolentis]ENO85961.1 cytochrome c-552 precourser [Thauera linaloolentis 47Lol = DSM 12138]MCM8567191.1 c-type cytochrome [Thauera linaloolentis]
MKKRVVFCVAVGVLASAPAAASLDIVKKARCVACHAVDKKMVGPSYRDVAAKYEGQADAAAVLANKVRSGGSGVWGAVPMTPNDAARISDENLKAAIEWILAGAPD